MKRFFIALLVLTIFLSGCGSKTSDVIKNNNAKQTYDFQYIKMTTQYIGWALGENKIYITSDKGKTWIDVSPANKNNIFSWYFLNENYSWVLYSDGTLYKTRNKGKSWVGSKAPFTMGKLFFLQKKDGLSGWMLKEYGPASGDSPVDVYKLIDSKWTLISKGKMPNNSLKDDNSISFEGEKTSFIFLPDAKTGIITVEYRIPGKYGLYLSSDSGYTWNKKDIPLLSKFKDDSILFYSPNFFDCEKETIVILPVCIYDIKHNDYQIIFMNSSDDGSTWKEVSSFSIKEKPIEINLVDKNNWIILTNNSLFITNNNDKTWNKVKPPKNTVQIQFIDSKNGWALVKSQLDTHLYYSNNGGSSWKKLF
ncbi:WD40/YVTN/BNR-like repeat-containing protein [Thermoanaerobacterium thermosaccharolyticum]|uniref:Sortilin N-terminal domain-containing protein n=1 Tax=Thermoanaerobacterium thermosaccharolyticum M0795 TaxID=698948 RepID=L0IJG8_THETR|nr:hypothetical protein [Thermoanaerobacterium thermosaccharolyticum]AGB19660.1 hypothetical protein Thethe_02068 [Thermoanaerobacterium thermosaccharolyticum M0795]